jgi:hypothetical protein
MLAHQLSVIGFAVVSLSSAWAMQGNGERVPANRTID